MSDRSNILTVVKKMLRESAVVGLDAAGSSLMGPLWHPFRRVIQPVAEEIQKQFPNAFLLDGTSNPDAAEIEKAIDALSSNSQLQEMLYRDVESMLGETREEIMSLFASIASRLEERIDQLEDALRTEIHELLKDSPGNELQAVDIDNELNEYIDALDPSMHQKLLDSPGTRAVVVAAIALGRFTMQVLEEGRIHNSYRIKSLDVTYFYTPLRRYKGENQNECCDYEVVSLQQGQKDSIRKTACRQTDGSWKDIKQF